MRPLLAYASDSSDSSDFEMDDEAAFPEIQLTATDWDALASICAKLDLPSGPAMFNTIDYNNACNELGIGPNTLWFGVYRILGEIKLGQPIKWSEALHQYKKYQLGLAWRRTSTTNYKRAKLRLFFSKWRLVSSLNNVLMAQCFAFEINHLLVPIFSSWKQQAGEQHALIDVCSDLEGQYSKYMGLETLERAQIKVAKYRASAERIYAIRQQRTVLETMECRINRLQMSSAKTNRKTVSTAFRNWRSYTKYAQLTSDHHRQTAEMCLHKIFAIARRLDSNITYAVQLDRFNRLTPCLQRLHSGSKALEQSALVFKKLSLRVRIRHWLHITHLATKAQRSLAHNELSIQISDAQACLAHWRSMAPLQIRAQQFRKSLLAKKALRVWRLYLKCRLFKDFREYQQLVRIMRYWYLKCSAEVHLQFREHTALFQYLSLWKARAESRYIENEQALAQVYRPRLIMSSVTRMVLKLKSRLRALEIVSMQADELSSLNIKRRGVSLFSTALDEMQSLEVKALEADLKYCGHNVLSKWRVSAENRRIMLLGQKADQHREKSIQTVGKRSLAHWKLKLEALNTKLRHRNLVLQRRHLDHWRGSLADYSAQLTEAESLHHISLKRLVVDTLRRTPGFKQELESRCALFDEIKGLALQQTIIRRIQIRLVRFRSQMAEAARIYDMNRQYRRKRVLRHWYSRANESPVEPMTPRSARRLPPTALRRIMQESRRRPERSSSTPSRTPTKVNRQLFPEKRP